MEENKEKYEEQKTVSYKLNNKQKSKFKFNYNQVLAFVAYIGIGFIAVALLLALIFKGDTKVSTAFRAVGEVIAYITCIVLAFSWVKKHKHIAWIVCYVIFVVTIVVLYILTI